jgi:hypothetical protein
MYLEKVGRELFEVLDDNEDLNLVKEDLENTSEDGLRYFWGLAYKFSSLAFVSTFQKKLLTSNEGNDTDKVKEAVTTASSIQDENGIRFAQSCESKCFIGEKRCAHGDLFRVELSQVGEFVVFPSVWWLFGRQDFLHCAVVCHSSIRRW